MPINALICSYSPNFSYAIEDALDYRNSFTDSIEYKKGFPSKGIAFISLDNQTISYFCIFEKSRKITTGKSLLRFKNAIQIDNPLLIDIILSAIPSRIKRYFPKREKNEISQLAPSVYASILNHIEENFPLIYQNIKKLESKLTPKFGRMFKSEILNFEKDSINLLLKIGGFSGYEIPEWNPIAEDAPFLSGFEGFNLLEDPMINYDSQVFGDWALIKRDVKGAIAFSKENCQITIFNANRTPIEETLGVDLLIYHHTYSAYVLIQYKRMTKEGSSNSYRPIDGSYVKEYQAMKDFLTRISSTSPTQIIDYRLNNDFFYFKLCPSTPDDPLSQKMITGMYIPLSYWDLLLSSDSTLGTRGGRVIQFENVQRHINNSLFVNLFQDGWIGSHINNSELISEQIRHSLQGNKSITFATIEEKR